MTVAAGSCASITLPIESQQVKKDKFSAINPILEPEVSLGTALIKLPQMIIIEPSFNHQKYFDFLRCKQMYELADMGNLYDCYPRALKDDFSKKKQKHIELSVKKAVLHM